MKLGEATQITIGTGNVDASCTFYERMGFRIIAEGDTPNKWLQMTDDALLLLLNEDHMEYVGLTYFSSQMEYKVNTLENAGVSFVHKSDRDDRFFQGIFLSPEGFGISLVNFDPSGSFQPKRINLLNFPKEYYNQPDKFPNKSLGIFGEFSQPVINLENSLSFWRALGFNVLTLNQQPYPWAIISDELNLMGLHQTHDFKYPAITYFAPDMNLRVLNLKKAGIHTIEDLGNNNTSFLVLGPDNIRFFLFSL
ncbi:MAG: VOC family protein [Bacteroidia bacterium]